ncbi:MAG: hypothetical protein QM308_00685 [Bacillota bacterium]|nr:hypothetical protein [Bacillota bacterium]
MKRVLSAMLTALMLLTILPLASPPARAEFEFEIYCTASSACVGDTFEWFISDVHGGIEPYQYGFDVYRNGVLYAPEDYRSDPYRYFTATAPGRYEVEVWVLDSNNFFYTKIGGAITVSAQRNKITKVEPLSATSLKITWNKVPGADKYYLWRGTSMNADWDCVTDTAGTTFTDTNLKAGTRYFYKVWYTHPEIYDSWFSPVVAGVPMGKTRITSITSPSKGRVRLAWAKAAGASGYQVLMATSARGSYKPVRLLTGTTVTFTGLKSGSGLYYKIRPYRRIYTTTCWGDYSAYRSIRVK